MNDQILDELIQRKLDGTATPEETRQVEQRLAADPAARARHAELEAVFIGLSGRTLESPPAGLGVDILRAVRRTPEAASRRRRTAPASRREWVRYLFPVAASFAAGAMVWAAFVGNRVLPASDAGLSGTMAGVGSPMQVLALGSAAQGITVTVQKGEGGTTILTLRSGESPVRIEVDADPRAVSLGPLPTPGAGSPMPDVAAGVFTTSLPAHSSTSLTCSPRSAQAAVRVTAKCADGSQDEGRLSLGWAPWTQK